MIILISYYFKQFTIFKQQKHTRTYYQYASLPFRHDVISINELLSAVETLQTSTDEVKLKKIVKVLDEDEDGVIGISEALKVRGI